MAHTKSKSITSKMINTKNRQRLPSDKVLLAKTCERLKPGSLLLSPIAERVLKDYRRVRCSNLTSRLTARISKVFLGASRNNPLVNTFVLFEIKYRLLILVSRLMDLTFNHNGVEITILDGPYLEHGRPTDRAAKDYTELTARLDELKIFAADKLLKLYNETWLDDEIGEVDRAGFIARLGNPSIHLYDELGAAVVYFDDGNLFAGHWIEVHLDNGAPTNAGIIG